MTGSPIVATRPTPRLDSLTGLRFLAAFVVFVHHAGATLHIDGFSGLIHRLTFDGVDGVSFFFILSGFVLAWSARDGDRPVAFYRRRAARILPLYLLAWGAGVLFVMVVVGERLITQVPSLLLVQAWFPQQSVHFAGNTVGWSLSCEALFYAAFPLILWWSRRMSVAGLWAAMVGALAVAVLLPILLHPVLPDGPTYWAAYVLPLSRLPEFVAGVMAARLLRSARTCPVPFPVALALAAVTIVASNWLPLWAYLSATTVVPFLLVIWSAASRDWAGARTWAAGRWLVKLGEWSYAFYLMHLLIMRVLAKANHTVHLSPWLLAGVALVLAIRSVRCAV